MLDTVPGTRLRGNLACSSIGGKGEETGLIGSIEINQAVHADPPWLDGTAPA